MIKKIVKAFYFALRRMLIGFVPAPKRGSLPAAGAELKILVIRLDRIGDLTLSTPVFKALRDAFPKARISVLAKKDTAEVIMNNPYVNLVSIYKGFWDTIAGHSRKYDLVIDMINDSGLKTALLSRLINAPFSIGFDAEGRGRFFSDPVIPSGEKKHFIEFISDLLAPLGISPKHGLDPEIFLDKGRLNAARAFLLSRFAAARAVRFIAVHPGSFYATQRWPGKYYAGLIEKISSLSPGTGFILLGNPKEKGLLQVIHGLLPEDIRRKAILTPEIGLGMTIALISLSRLFIGNNSGLLHIAAALKVPTVSFMGPTIPWLWRPWGPAETNLVFREDLPCGPCNKGKCNELTCMVSITPAQVFETAGPLLKQVLKDAP